MLLLMTTAPRIAWAQVSGRESIPVNQNWSFKKIDSLTADRINNKRHAPADYLTSDMEQVSLPHTWNNHDMQVGRDFYQGSGMYVKKIAAPGRWKDKRIFIKFEGVGAVADLYVNNVFIGEHKGAYSAFVFEIGNAVRFDTVNTIVVLANNQSRPDVIPINHFLFGVYGGIYRPAEILITDKLNITTTDDASPGVYISQDDVSRDSAGLTVLTRVENKYAQGQNAVIQTQVLDAAGKQVTGASGKYWISTQGTQQYAQHLRLDNPHLWQGMDDPYLYKVVVSILQNGKLIDRVEQPLGVRKFELTKGEGLLVNGRPLRLKGVTRHQEWWGLGSALSNSRHDTDLAIIRDMGANSIRFAHYQQSEYLYSRCDSIGFIIWAEIPFVNAYSGREADNAKQQLTELIKQNFNHPSIYVWGLHNEVYNKGKQNYVSTLTAELNNIAKTLDPHRYTASTDGYGVMGRRENNLADIQGMNRYYGWYEGETGDLQKWVTGLAEQYPNHHVALTEYGAEGNVDQQAEVLPAFDPVHGQYFPEQLQTRLHEIQWGILEKTNYLTATYLWNTFDFAVPYWSRGGTPARNMKGLVTFDRKIKKDAYYWYKANWNKAPMIYISDRRLVSRTIPLTTVTVYSNTGVPELLVNGKKIAGPDHGFTSVHFIFKNVQLKKGPNKILARAHSGVGTLSDMVQWVLK
ncbi:MAG TPA: glycoside hydrolase family 2 TIM barrel-domain containing protein [Puia sp.]